MDTEPNDTGSEARNTFQNVTGDEIVWSSKSTADAAAEKEQKRQ